MVCMTTIDSRRGELYWEKAAREARLDLDQVASHNSILPYWYHRGVRAQQIQRLAQEVRAHPGPRRVLDLGCGPGLWGLALAPYVDSWLGLDIAPAFVAEADRRARELGCRHLTFRVGSLHELPDGTYDIIVLGGTLSLLDDSELLPLLESVRHRLRPDGFVYVRVSTVPRPYPPIRMNGQLPIKYRNVRDYERVFRQAGLTCRTERDRVFTESMLATVYAYLGGERALKLALRARSLCFGLAARLLDLTPVPRSTLLWLRRAA